MTTKAGPFDIVKTRLILNPQGIATPKDVSDAFFGELGTEFGGFKGHILISRFDFDEPWPTWEIHPEGDEFVYLLSGDADVFLKNEAGEQTLHVDVPGSYVVVPRGTWHTARPRRPTSMLFVTPGEGTENRETPEY